VTGGAGSLGLASAKLLHKEGASVMLVDLDDAALEKAAGEIGGDLRCVSADCNSVIGGAKSAGRLDLS